MRPLFYRSMYVVVLTVHSRTNFQYCHGSSNTTIPWYVASGSASILTFDTPANEARKVAALWDSLKYPGRRWPPGSPSRSPSRRHRRVTAVFKWRPTGALTLCTASAICMRRSAPASVATTMGGTRVLHSYTRKLIQREGTIDLVVSCKTILVPGRSIRFGTEKIREVIKRGCLSTASVNAEHFAKGAKPLKLPVS